MGNCIHSYKRGTSYHKEKHNRLDKPLKQCANDDRVDRLDLAVGKERPIGIDGIHASGSRIPEHVVSHHPQC